uniref:Uncharacterized protein n=1 Tax=Spongospora subterranea TaxID=70186 RepID=A0A0H5QWT6_9EUKA|eukprot:CRZ06380.1 hypothetical protein [Spongospora subterranea]
MDRFGDGWSPLGDVWKALRERVPSGYKTIHDPEVEFWADGGAAAHRYKNTKGEDANHTDEKSQIELGHKITSSYEAEIIALHAGLELDMDKNFKNRTIHIMTDSSSWVSQFQFHSLIL